MFKVYIESKTRIKDSGEPSSWSAVFKSEEEAQKWLEEQKKKVDRKPEQAIYIIQDLSKNLEWQNEQIIKERKKEYPPLEQLLHVLMDCGIDSPEWVDIQQKRQEIKQKYPKV